MPQFQLNDNDLPGYLALPPFVQGYIKALFFTECDGSLEDGTYDPENGSPLPGEAGYSDLALHALDSIVTDCTAFYTQHADKWQQTEADDEQAGIDFWLTRNGHGAGFWDRPDLYGKDLADALTAAAKEFGESDAYLGTDGKVYVS